MGFRQPSPVTMATYRGHRMTVTEWPDLASAIGRADVAVQGSSDLAVVRDKLNIMRYAADATGRTWTQQPGRHAAGVAGWRR